MHQHEHQNESSQLDLYDESLPQPVHEELVRLWNDLLWKLVSFLIDLLLCKTFVYQLQLYLDQDY